jgi:hypothetical protein
MNVGSLQLKASGFAPSVVPRPDLEPETFEADMSIWTSSKGLEATPVKLRVSYPPLFDPNLVSERVVFEVGRDMSTGSMNLHLVLSVASELLVEFGLEVGIGKGAAFDRCEFSSAASRPLLL